MSEFSGGHGEKKSRKLDAFIAAVLSHPTIEGAAAAVGVAGSTARRWLQDPAVVQRLAEARRDSMRATMSRLQANATRAADNLDKLQQTAESEAVRLAAARANLEFAFRATELTDIQERIDRLEELAKNRWKGPIDEPPNPTATGTTRGPNGRP